MVNVNALKGKIVENDMTLEGFAKAINMPNSTFQRRMKKGVFGSDEIERILDVLHIDDPSEIERIFFAGLVI